MMTYAILAVRVLLGLTFVVFGLNHFLKFISMENPGMPEAAANFAGALNSSGYLNAVKVFEITGGLLLVTGILVPLGLVLLVPVLVNIVFFDLFLVQKPGFGLVLLAMAIYLIWAYRPYFQAVFTIKAQPVVKGL